MQSCLWIYLRDLGLIDGVKIFSLIRSEISWPFTESISSKTGNEGRPFVGNSRGSWLIGQQKAENCVQNKLLYTCLLYHFDAASYAFHRSRENSCEYKKKMMKPFAKISPFLPDEKKNFCLSGFVFDLKTFKQREHEKFKLLQLWHS